VKNAPCAAGREKPGELLSLVMDGLSGSGLDVRPGEGGLVAIARPGARCALAVGDCGRAEWEYCPGSPADPGLAADATTTLLTGRPGPFPRLAGSRERSTFKGSVGRGLTARGLEAGLAVCTDEAAFDVFAEIVATAPGGDEDAQVHVARRRGPDLDTRVPGRCRPARAGVLPGRRSRWRCRGRGAGSHACHGLPEREQAGTVRMSSAGPSLCPSGAPRPEPAGVTDASKRQGDPGASPDEGDNSARITARPTIPALAGTSRDGTAAGVPRPGRH